MIDELEWIRLMGAVGASVVLENPAPIMHYFEDLIARNMKAIKESLPGVAEEAIRAAFERVIKGNGTALERIANGPLEIKAGVVTYQRSVFGGTRVPNHHQFYIAFRFYNPGTDSVIQADGSSRTPPVVSGAQPTTSIPVYSMVFMNRSDETKRLLFRWGESYAWEFYYLAPYECRALVMAPIPFQSPPVRPQYDYFYWITTPDGGLGSIQEGVAMSGLSPIDTHLPRLWGYDAASKSWKYNMSKGTTVVNPYSASDIAIMANDPNSKIVSI
jgi:hypothetical protein